MKKILPLLILILTPIACTFSTGPTVNQADVATIVAAELTRDAYLTQAAEAARITPTKRLEATFRPPVGAPLQQSVSTVAPPAEVTESTPIPSLTVAVPTPIPQVIKKSGVDSQIVPVPEMVPGYYFLGLTKNGDGVFTVFATDEAGNRTILFLDTTGAYSGWLYVSPEMVVPRFEVVATGEWTIELRPNVPNAVPKITAPTGYHGEGDVVLAVTCCSVHKPDYADFMYQTEAPFAVYSISKEGERVELINQQGPYMGQVTFPNRMEFIEVRAKGGWDMNMAERPAN